MKKSIFGIAFAVCAFFLASVAMAAPILSGVTADETRIICGQDGWTFEFDATEGGRLGMQLTSSTDGAQSYELGAADIVAGHGRIGWNGLMPDGSAVPAGSYLLCVQLRNAWGEESAASFLSVSVFADEADMAANTLDLSALTVVEAQSWDDAPIMEALPIEEAQPMESAAKSKTDESGVPVASGYWDMNPDAYDLSNPLHQQAIWDLMMQPMTVLDVGQTEHVYPTTQPGISVKPYETNCAGEIHGQSAGVHVLEEDTDGDGYVLIEAYSNDGTKTNNSYMKSIDAKLVQGYVKKSLLKTVKPSTKHALLIDKMKQKLYIFEAGRIIGELDISTGLNNDNQPYNESPAGEFITVSRVGEFVSGTMRAQYAIRINGGTLLHEVPYRYGGDGKTKIYSEFEPELGKKASHGCIRIQRRKNAQGQNMLWLWNNLELKTKVFIWDDQGREMYDPADVIPAADTQLYRNPNGGTNYHIDQNCSGVKEKFLPLTGDLTYGDLDSSEFANLTPCVYCGAPQTKALLYERYAFEAKQIGAEVSEAAKAAFGK